jgi:hypothetical protein
MAAAQSTTTTIPAQAIDPTTTAADNPAQQTLQWIIGGLILLAIVVLVCTVLFWRRTKPTRAGHRVGSGESPPEGTRVSAAQLAARGRAVSSPVDRMSPVAGPPADTLRDAPMWADEPSGEERPPRRTRAR